jgi:hypothetical protein
MESRITPLTTIRRERMLPVRGEVLVHPGEAVGPADVVARCHLPGEIRVVDIARCLGVRAETATKLIRKATGDPVKAEDTLAAPGGILGRLRRPCRSPVDGYVIAVRNGLVLIEEEPAAFALSAHLKGQVASVMPEWGVVIATVGVLIQGMWGSGGEAEGILKVVVDNPQRPLRAHAIDVSCQGTLVVGGRLLEEKALEQAIEAKVRGIIAGSVNAELRPRLQNLPFPVLITEGFGTLPMSEPVFSLLEANVGREAMLSAHTQSRWGAKRPEVIVPLRAEEQSPAEEPGLLPLEEGAQVRVLRLPYFGAIGTISHLPHLPQKVESGARLPIAEVDLGEEKPVPIPLTNLERIR